jgi:surfactin synthase thioesterase subunit
VGSHRCSAIGIVCFVPVQLPGRETRFDEPFLESIPELASQLAQVVLEAGRTRIAIFGHSMGALLGFETAHHLAREGVKISLLAVSAHASPGRSSAPEGGNEPELSERSALAVLESLGGTHPEILKHPELRMMLLERFLADTRALRQYAFHEAQPLSSNLLALGGREDDFVPPSLLDEWSRYASGRSRTILFPGGHFYLRDYGRAVRRCIALEILCPDGNSQSD